MTIAFKQAKDTKIANQLPDNYIVEWIDASLLPDKTGWQLLPDADFQTLLAQTNTQQNVDSYNNAKYQKMLAEQLAIFQAQQKP